MKRTIMAPPIPNLRADYDQGEGMRGIQPPSLQVQSHSHPQGLAPGRLALA
jgi:hypothetical protein